VPDVTGAPIAEARLRLELAKLAAGRISEVTHPTMPAGSVISQGATAGTEAHAGAAIDLAVSKGPETAVVPTLVGRSKSKASELATQSGFVVGQIKYKADEDRSDGVVIEQNPAAGLPAPKGSKVDLVVNQLD
jgi:serine/threonine-protein kinase